MSVKWRYLSLVAFSFLTFSQRSVLAEGETPSTIKIDGSSTVFPITEAMAEEFQKEKKGVRVTVGISGTGGGFKKFCRGETDVQNASRPITKEEMATCKTAGIQYFEIPVGYDAITLAVSKKNTWVKSITVEDLKKIWAPEAQGKITNWNQVRKEWPDVPLKLYGAGSDSGTFDYFTEAIVGKAKSSRGDYTASEDDNTLVTGIANDKGALGFIPFSYYEANQKTIKALAVDGGPKAPKKGAIEPTAKTMVDGSYYPLSRPIFIYLNSKSTAKAEVKDFLSFYIKKAPSIVPSVKYVALPQKAYDMGMEHFNKGKLGTVFNGEPMVGIRIEELLKREAKL